MAGTTVDEGGLVHRVLDETVSDVTGTPVPPSMLARWKGTSKREAVAGLLRELGAPHHEDDVASAVDDFSERLVAAYR